MDRRSISSTQAKPKPAGAKIPDQPRDCGPNVDTWPILDTPADAARKQEAKPQKPAAS